MSNEIMQKNVVKYDIKEMAEIGKVAVASGYFQNQDVETVPSAVMKIMAGAEMGFSAFTSLQGVNIIKGRAVLSANLMASAVKSCGKYNYKILEHNDKKCIIEFFEIINGSLVSVGTSSFSIENAREAGLLTPNKYGQMREGWAKYPRNMLFARALSNGVRWYAPDALNGTVAYTPDELDCNEDKEGNLIKDITPKIKATKAIQETKEVEQTKEIKEIKEIKEDNHVTVDVFANLKSQIEQSKTIQELASVWQNTRNERALFTDEQKAEISQIVAVKKSKLIDINQIEKNGE